MSATLIPAVHLVCTTLMAGVIVFVQVVHYPLMARVGEADFGGYQAGHTSRTGLVVIPLMVVELATALWLIGFPPSPSHRPAAYIGAALLAVIWLSTMLVQAPAHRRLSGGFDPAVHRHLVRWNWIRTVAWMARLPVALALMG